MSFHSPFLMAPPTFRRATTVLIWWRQSSPRQQSSHQATSSSAGRRKDFTTLPSLAACASPAMTASCQCTSRYDTMMAFITATSTCTPWTVTRFILPLPARLPSPHTQRLTTRPLNLSPQRKPGRWNLKSGHFGLGHPVRANSTPSLTMSTAFPRSSNTTHSDTSILKSKPTYENNPPGNLPNASLQ